MSYKIYSVAELTKFSKKSFRDQENVFLAEGRKLAEEVFASNLDVLQILATDKFLLEHRQFLLDQRIDVHKVTVIAEHTAARIADTTTPQGMFVVVKKPMVDWSGIIKQSLVIVLENIRDPGNLGTMLRTADWFGAKAVIVSENGTDPYNPKVLRAAMGSLFHLQVYSSSNLVNDLRSLKKENFTLITTRPEANQTSLPEGLKKIALIMGNESTGTSVEIDEVADFSYAIPRRGQAESLNVAISFGIVLHQLTSTR